MSAALYSVRFVVRYFAHGGLLMSRGYQFQALMNALGGRLYDNNAFNMQKMHNNSQIMRMQV